MSTQYPILDGRPINKWKVAELKEELKRRKLMTKGLKDDLVKRLDEAIHNEQGAFDAEANKGFDSQPEPIVEFEHAQSQTNYIKMADDAQNHNVNKTSNLEEVVAGVHIGDVPSEMGKWKLLKEEAVSGTDSVVMVADPAVLEVYVETSSIANDFPQTQTALSMEAFEGNKFEAENEILKSPQKDAVRVGEPEVLEASMGCCDIVNEAVATQIASEEKTFENNKIKVDNEDLNSSQLDANLVEGAAVSEASKETSSTVDHIVVPQIGSSEQELKNNEAKLENEGSKPLQMDAECDAPDSGNQVYEVGPNLGFQVKSESISTDTVSINEKKELKDNLNADNVHFELEVGDQGFIEETDDNKSTHMDLSKKIDCADEGSSAMSKLNQYSVDDSMLEDVLENKPIDISHNNNKLGHNNDLIEVPIAKVGSPVNVLGTELSLNKTETFAVEKSDLTAPEERNVQDENISRDVDFSKRIDMADGEQFEKINLDHSSPDDSMEEDVSETKHIDSEHNSNKVGEKSELTEVPGVDVSGSVDAPQPDLSSNKLEPSPEKRDDVAVFSEKRKFQDESAVGTKEPPKRQRRWNSESLNTPEPQGSSVLIQTMPKDLVETTIAKHNFTRSESTLSVDAPKERLVPPSPKPPTSSLRIDNFLRPFTLKAVQELLGKTGTICSFWMDHIKTHCYVTYSSIEEAIGTRNAVYNLQWPPNGGRLLVAEFIDPKEVKLRIEGPAKAPAAPVSRRPAVPPTPAPSQQPLPASQQSLKQHLPQQLPVAPPPSTSKQPTKRERIHPPPPPPLTEKVDPPIVTLDDLFRKTEVTPRIYYLPLTEEQVAAKLARQGKENR